MDIANQVKTMSGIWKSVNEKVARTIEEETLKAAQAAKSKPDK